MSEATFRTEPYKGIQTLENYKMQRKNYATCWLCGYRTAQLGKYADHVERHRKENWIPRPVATSKNRTLVFAEWQQEIDEPKDDPREHHLWTGNSYHA